MSALTNVPAAPPSFATTSVNRTVSSLPTESGAENSPDTEHRRWAACALREREDDELKALYIDCDTPTEERVSAIAAAEAEILEDQIETELYRRGWLTFVREVYIGERPASVDVGFVEIKDPTNFAYSETEEVAAE